MEDGGWRQAAAPSSILYPPSSYSPPCPQCLRGEQNLSHPRQPQVQDFRRAEESHRQSAEPEAAVDDQPGPVDPVDSTAQAVGEGVVAEDGHAARQADLPAVRVAGQEQVGLEL